MNMISCKIMHDLTRRPVNDNWILVEAAELVANGWYDTNIRNATTWLDDEDSVDEYTLKCIYIGDEFIKESGIHGYDAVVWVGEDDGVNLFVFY